MPTVTLELLLTAALIPLSIRVLWGAIKRKLEAQDKQAAEIEALKAEAARLREKALDEWRKNFSGTQCAIKEKLEELAGALHDRVTWDHCNRLEKETRDNLKSLGDKIAGTRTQ